jgi:uncharacterized protein YfiM (DUF2279 family)
MNSRAMKVWARLLKRRRLRASFLAAVLLVLASSAAAHEFHLFPETSALPADSWRIDWSDEPTPRIAEFAEAYPWAGATVPELSADAALRSAVDFQESASASPHVIAPAPKLFTTPTTLVTAGALLGGALDALSAPLQYGWISFRTTNEHWFGRSTYAGGADKASHFTVSSGISRNLYDIYVRQGHGPDESAALAFATTFMMGHFVEILDGVSVYGYSLQDLTADAVGSAAGVLIHRFCVQDLIGFRLGPADTPDLPASVIGSSQEYLGTSYINEIYVGDLKLGGLITRMGGKPGFARFFLTSFAFFTKGFGYVPPLPTRYQEIGFEFGLNFVEILKAVGVTDQTWWGAGLIAVFDFFRIPFTQVGVYYNLYNHKWYGPGAPYHYY